MLQNNRPTVRDELIEINDDLDVNYGVFKNAFTFRRPPGSWQHFPELSFVAPSANAKIAEPFAQGVEWGAYEHVSVVINGSADYQFETPDGRKTWVWSYGDHNVEDGVGYLPKGTFIRTFSDDFTLCCILQRRTRALGVTYGFEVVTGTKVLDRDVLFVHYATGARQKQTDFNLKAGDVIDIAAPDIAIVGWIK